MSFSLKSIFKKFRSDSDGTISIEAVLMFPMLLWVATATYTYFDVYKVQNATYRANYTVSDMLSRETNAIDADYTDGLFKVFRYMTNATVANSWMRISVVNCLSDCGTDARVLDFDWSHGVNGAEDLEDVDMPYVDDVIPLFSEGDRLILVQTSTEYDPPFSSALTGFASRTIKTDIVTRPRFAPLLVWDTADDGGEDAPDTPDGL